MDAEIRDHPAASRYEAWLGDELAGYVMYREHDDQLVLVHTEVAPSFAGHGIAGQLARFVLDAARQSEREVVPRCEYIAGYIASHPEYADLVPPAWKGLIGPRR